MTIAMKDIVIESRPILFLVIKGLFELYDIIRVVSYFPVSVVKQKKKKKQNKTKKQRGRIASHSTASHFSYSKIVSLALPFLPLALSQFLDLQSLVSQFQFQFQSYHCFNSQISRVFDSILTPFKIPIIR
ncbi:hypothetical protein RIF29_41832 [Crotalaria pallida]|uniref:Uncharacterized protein n=1 Tax=Crotalaria pallida TaxID=3830 RepID=A0AAN9HRW7_CROPI